MPLASSLYCILVHAEYQAQSRSYIKNHSEESLAFANGDGSIRLALSHGRDSAGAKH